MTEAISVTEAERDIEGGAALMSADPLIICTGATMRGLFGITDLLGRCCADRPAVFLVRVGWDCEYTNSTTELTEAVRSYRARHPGHEVIVLCNTPREVESFDAVGVEAVFANHNIFTSEDVFHPLPQTAQSFDAVYNARPHPQKRHELAAEIERVAYLSYSGGPPAIERAVTAELLARGPRHVLINEIEKGLPKWLSPQRVNEVLAQSGVGLCLSEVEGAMNSSMECMMAGLPLVSTPSTGGRDVFFDPDYCVIAPPDPRAIRDAVAALNARGIPREYVRARTLAKVEPLRQAFLAFFEEIRERHGVPREYGRRWPFIGSPFFEFQSVREHARKMFQSEAPELRRKKAPAGLPGGVPEALYSTDVVAYALHDNSPKLAPAVARRAWMDDFPGNAANVCVPMLLANAYGWDVLCPAPIEVHWNGGISPDDLTIRALKPLPGGVPVNHLCTSHFSNGIVTMHLGHLFRTDPGWNLVVTGPFNAPKANAYPLTGIVDTDALPYPFTMNWQILEPGRARFEEGEPICSIFPVRMEAVLNARPQLKPLAANPELKREFERRRAERERRLA